jgi:L-phenylalanine/L-methionine N-acetyltransferase
LDGIVDKARTLGLRSKVTDVTDPDGAAAVTVRGLEDRDHQAVHDLLTTDMVVEGTMRVPHSPLSSTVSRLEPTVGVHHLVAEVAGRVVGFAEVVRSPSEPRHAHVAELNMVCTHPEFTGQGVGRKLTETVIDLADNWLNVRRLGLIVFADNPRAIRLYERLGFEHEGVMREFGFKRGGYVDAVVMGRIRR